MQMSNDGTDQKHSTEELFSGVTQHTHAVNGKKHCAYSAVMQMLRQVKTMPVHAGQPSDFGHQSVLLCWHP